jgi:hypothetical protein
MTEAQDIRQNGAGMPGCYCAQLLAGGLDRICAYA